MKPIPAALPLILLSLLAAIWTGWIRGGWELPLPQAAGQHGNLMVNCFLATLILLERAVTFRQWWVRLLPLLNALALLPLLAGAPQAALGMQLAGSVGFAVLCGWLLYRHRELYYLVFLTGALSLVVANSVLLQSGSYPAATGWWVAFLLLTIVAERLELSKFLPRSPAQRNALLACLALILPGLLLPMTTGKWLLAAALGGTGCWLLRYDMARISVRLPGAHRYSGRLLLAGYCWLPVASVLILLQHRIPLGYDAVLHSFFLGFVFSMIFAHAPVILPAVLKKRLTVYHPLLYAWFGWLQVSLLVRIGADIAGDASWRRGALLGNGLPILLFFVTVAVRVSSGLRSGKA
ncbi:hypothetical protein EPD60_16405 [Flaviaesturariibacter flavus]|uniref:NnrS family protein n=1 Tax=Flaviaesturariibacter flavus TaxID=2502780 RepID=A0A4R1B828_9BACT|nr:hypothetical protein [Flaviaesturariibacter flavus]TCJ12133.1 hypothetical protein EPD60_16405 [Flaviaesturariibacter flavus]